MWEVLRIALSDDGSSIDAQILFHVIAEAVAKVRDRNTSFWMTVMTITGSSIAWVDFRRKLSKWLSTNGMGISQIKNVISFVQQNVDPMSSGLVKKEVFLKFTDDLMGHDCLLSPESFLSVTLNTQTPLIVTASPISIEKEVLSKSPIIAPHGGDHVSPAESGSGLTTIRLKLAVESLQKLFASRQRMSFAVLRIVGIDARQMTTDQAKKVPPKVREELNSSAVAAIVLAVQLPRVRVLTASFFRIYSCHRQRSAPILPLMDEATDESQQESDSGPSWTVTIQAVAVANLFGILRTCLSRATMPAYFSLKAGHSVDVYNPLRKVLWAQSTQGKRDALVANGKVLRGALEPINENISIPTVGKELPQNGHLEFDLSI